MQFSEYFFNILWGSLKEKNNLKLKDLAEQSYKIIKEEGEKLDLIITGEYNPIINKTKVSEKFYPGTFLTFLGVQEAENINNILSQKKVKLVNGPEATYESLNNPNANFYFHSNGCEYSRVIRAYVEEILEERDIANSPITYVVYSNEKERSMDVETITEHFGFEYGFPQFAKIRDGKVVKHQEGIPFEPISYGNLPDKEIGIISKTKLREIFL